MHRSHHPASRKEYRHAVGGANRNGKPPTRGEQGVCLPDKPGNCRFQDVHPVHLGHQRNGVGDQAEFPESPPPVSGRRIRPEVQRCTIPRMGAGEAMNQVSPAGP